jgi:hypothetical protein
MLSARALGRLFHARPTRLTRQLRLPFESSLCSFASPGAQPRGCDPSARDAAGNGAPLHTACGRARAGGVCGAAVVPEEPASRAGAAASQPRRCLPPREVYTSFTTTHTRACVRVAQTRAARAVPVAAGRAAFFGLLKCGPVIKVAGN